MTGSRARGLLAAALMILAPAAPAGAHDGGATWPRLACYCSQVGRMSPAERDSLARYDLLVHLWTIRPEDLRDLRRRNPKLRVLSELEPQYVQIPESSDPWWLPDTLWSITRRMEWYAARNDWYLRDTTGAPIRDGGRDVLVNWTRFCPEGTFGSSKGLRASIWYARAFAEIATSGSFWRPWGWDSLDTVNGTTWEILADCIGSYAFAAAARAADPDRDGRPDGVWSPCAAGGTTQPLSVLMREENAAFWRELKPRIPPDLVMLANDGGDAIDPAFRVEWSGAKEENWNFPETARSWWDWMYGARGRGYLWTFRRMERRPQVVILKTMDDHGRRARYALGTTALLDGWFYLSPGGARDEHDPDWQPAWDRDWGKPLAPMAREAHGADTIYVRTFERATVRVNPQDHAVAGVPARDAEISGSR